MWQMSVDLRALEKLLEFLICFHMLYLKTPYSTVLRSILKQMSVETDCHITPFRIYNFMFVILLESMFSVTITITYSKYFSRAIFIFYLFCYDYSIANQILQER